MTLYLDKFARIITLRGENVGLIDMTWNFGVTNFVVLSSIVNNCSLCDRIHQIAFYDE
jgi:hypothetical protein